MDDELEEHWRERNGVRMYEMVYSRVVFKDRDKWRHFCIGHPLDGNSQREQISEMYIDRMTKNISVNEKPTLLNPHFYATQRYHES